MTDAEKKERQDRVAKFLPILHSLFPDAHTELNFSNPWEFLVAVQLSAQSTDVQVNKLTAKLFAKYPNFEDYLHADPEEFTKDIAFVLYYKNKARNVLAAAKILESRIKNQELSQTWLPATMGELLKLPGVARKTANVILGEIFHKAEGIVVDTHVIRLSQKFDLSDFSDAVRIEKDLMEIVPKEEWIFFGNAIVWYGRKICPARKHDCALHPLTQIFPEAGNRWPGR